MQAIVKAKSNKAILAYNSLVKFLLRPILVRMHR